MKQATRRILKKSEVTMEGSFCLGAVQDLSGHNNTKPGAIEPQVKILENQNEYALISLTCSCGRQTIVRCEYTQAENSELLTTKN